MVWCRILAGLKNHLPCEKIVKKIILTVASLLFFCVVPATSFAHSYLQTHQAHQFRYSYQPHHFHQAQPRGSIGFYYGPSWHYPPTFNYPPFGNAPYIVQQPAPPTVYIERNIAPLESGTYTSQQDGYWFFCASSNTYYPYVRECAEPWQRVAPTPPQQTR